MMNIKVEKVNTLPAPTWRWLKMNDTVIDCPNPGTWTQLAPHLTNPVSGISVTAQAPNDFPKINTGAGSNAEEFARTHAGTVQNIVIAEDTQADEPVVFTYKLHDGAFFVDDSYVYAKKGSKSTIVFAYDSDYNAGGFHAASVKIYAEENAEVEVIQLQTLGKNFYSLDDVGSDSQASGVVKVNQIELGAAKAWAGINSELTAAKAQAHIKSSYIVQQDQSLDLNYVVNIWGKKTESTVLSSGILMHNAKKIMRGTLDFKRGSKGSVGNESEDVLLLDPDIQNKSIPLILCGEEDIEGNHAASIGEIDEKELYYLRTRGLDDKSIRHMQIESRIQLMCNELPEQLHQQVIDYRQEAYKNE